MVGCIRCLEDKITNLDKEAEGLEEDLEKFKLQCLCAESNRFLIICNKKVMEVKSVVENIVRKRC